MNDNSTLKIKNQIRHERDDTRLRRCICGVIAGILAAAGFAFAAQQHFTALEQSIRNVEMQKQRERLKSEQKRLIYEREMASSPAQLETRARKIGLQNVSVEQINSLLDDNEASENSRAQTTEPKSKKPETAFVKSKISKAN